MNSSSRPLRFLFWNIHGRDLGNSVVSLAGEHSVDLLCLAEASGLNRARLIVALNQQIGPEFHLADSGLADSVVVTRFERGILGKNLSTRSRWAFHVLRLPGRSSLIVGLVHLPILKTEELDRFALATKLSEEIQLHESRENHRRTLLFGDFNMDPFEAGMQGATSLHAILSRREIEARSGERKWQGDSYPMFFNPMWQHLGGRDGGPPGTYFYPEPGVVRQYWHVFDQCLIRPELMHRLPDKGVRILFEASNESLLNQHGRPNADRFSDHLPLLFELDF